MSVPADERITTPAGYESWDAKSKLAWLWDDLIRGTEYDVVERPDLSRGTPIQMLKIAGSKKNLQRTFDHTGDLMPPDRVKIIHQQGSVARVELVTLPESPHTGVLAPSPGGGAQGLMRMSLATPPVKDYAFTPGFGLKLVVDGAPSLDTIAMNHTVGQRRDVNIFANSFTTDLRGEHKELRRPQKAMDALFRRVSKQPRWFPVSHFAETTRTGERVAVPNRPHRLVFRPDAEVRRRFRTRYVEDFRESLARIEPGTVLYHVDSVDERDEAQPVGRIVLEARFVASRGGDRLFFRHNIAPEDRIRT